MPDCSGYLKIAWNNYLTFQNYCMSSRLKDLTSTGFIIALLLLLANDFFLKAQFGNWFTGKLSDFSGLFIFPIFWTVLFPKHKLAVYFGTVLFFLWWKSFLSGEFIETVNHLSPLHIGRVVDYSDYLAFLMLPVSYWYHGKAHQTAVRISPAFIFVLTAFSFAATSTRETRFTTRKTYDFNIPLDTLRTSIYHLEGVQNYFADDYMNYLQNRQNKYKDSVFTDSIPIQSIYSRHYKILHSGKRSSLRPFRCFCYPQR